MNDINVLKEGIIVEYGKNSLYATIIEVKVHVDPFIVMAFKNGREQVTPEVAIQLEGSKGVSFVLNNGMHKTVGQIKAAYEKNIETGDLEKVFDKEAYQLWKKMTS